MASRAKPGHNQPPRPIIVKKIVGAAEAGHHGGAWKVAYADFVTAMMAFFLLMWLLGATNEKQRKALADYFNPSLVETKQSSAGAFGPFGGDNLAGKDSFPTTKTGLANRALTMPLDATGGEAIAADRRRFEDAKRALRVRLQSNPATRARARNLRFTETREGMRIDIVDEADFSMFAMGTDKLLPEAAELIREVAGVVKDLPNAIMVRGHTDAVPYVQNGAMNNWLLSSARAEATRYALEIEGVMPGRFARLEGVADREPFSKDKYDPRNRRMSITLAWSGPSPSSGPPRSGPGPQDPASPAPARPTP